MDGRTTVEAIRRARGRALWFAFAAVAAFGQDARPAAGEPTSRPTAGERWTLLRRDGRAVGWLRRALSFDGPHDDAVYDEELYLRDPTHDDPEVDARRSRRFEAAARYVRPGVYGAPPEGLSESLAVPITGAYLSGFEGGDRLGALTAEISSEGAATAIYAPRTTATRAELDALIGTERRSEATQAVSLFLNSDPKTAGRSCWTLTKRPDASGEVYELAVVRALKPMPTFRDGEWTQRLVFDAQPPFELRSISLAAWDEPRFDERETTDASPNDVRWCFEADVVAGPRGRALEVRRTHDRLLRERRAAAKGTAGAASLRPRFRATTLPDVVAARLAARRPAGSDVGCVQTRFLCPVVRTPYGESSMDDFSWAKPTADEKERLAVARLGAELTRREERFVWAKDAVPAGRVLRDDKSGVRMEFDAAGVLLTATYGDLPYIDPIKAAYSPRVTIRVVRRE
jgi:hypothetical protein